jgi:hypothetical protein
VLRCYPQDSGEVRGVEVSLDFKVVQMLRLEMKKAGTGAVVG